jgi:hypothetical protein
MKTMTRKHGVCALAAAVLLATAVLVTSCPAEPEAGYKPPAGMGAIQLTFNKAIQRTLLPDGVDFDDLQAFTLNITPDPNDAWVAPLEVQRVGSGSISFGPINMDPDTYTLDVIGYLDADMNQPVAAVSKSGIVINSGDVETIELTLKALDPATTDGVGQGKFKWSIDAAALAVAPAFDVTAGTISFTPIGTGGAASVDLFDPDPSDPKWTGEIDLTAGYYYVDFALTVDVGTNPPVAVTFRRILHIYRNMETECEYILTKDLFFRVVSTTSATMTFTITDIDPITDLKPILHDGTSPIAEKGTVSLTGTGSVTIEVTNNPPYTSVEWYSGSTTTLTPATATTLLVTAGTAPFTVGLHQLTVVGIRSGIPYETIIYIDVEP